MTDWAAPGGQDDRRTTPGPVATPPSVPPHSAAPPPRYGELAPPGWTPPQPQPQAAWTPPPRPGLLPLRPLGFGDLLASAFNVIKRNPRPTFGLALLMSLATIVIVSAIVAPVTYFMFTRAAQASLADQEALTAGAVLVTALTAFATAILSSALTGVVQGIISLEVARGTVGERHTLRSLWAAARGRLLAVIGWTLLVSAVVTTAFILVAGVAILLGASGSPVGIVLAVLVTLLLGAGALVLSAWVGTKLALVPAVLLIERRTIGAAIRRSWRLTDGNFWRIFGTLLLVNVIINTASQIVITPISMLGGFASAAINPNQSADAAIGFAIALLLLTAIVSVLFTALVMVAQTALPAVFYVDVRMRKEGLDLELQHYVEQKAAGGVPEDPYLRGLDR